MEPAKVTPAPGASLLRMQFMSDLHIEFAKALDLLPPWTANAPVLALLGDIGKAKQDKYTAFIEKQAKMFERVLVLFGNHEYYHCDSYDTLIEDTRKTLSHLPNVTIMQKTRLEIGGVCILGTTLWSHVPAEDSGAVSRALNDYLVIRVGAGSTKRRITPDDTNAWHKDERAWLETEIAAAKARNQPVVVLTHHAPLTHGTSAPKFDGNQINVAFSTQLESLMGPPVMAWLYGHTHYNNSQVKKGTLVACNQVGYSMMAGEREGFEPNQVLEVTASGAVMHLPAVPSRDARPPKPKVVLVEGQGQSKP